LKLDWNVPWMVLYQISGSVFLYVSIENPRCLSPQNNDLGLGHYRKMRVRISVMVFNATFNNISVISWWSVLLVEETGVPRENHRPVTSDWQTWSHNVISSTPRHERDSNSQRYWW